MHNTSIPHRLTAVLFAMVLAVLPLVGASAADVDILGLIYGGDLHLRETPSLDAEIIATYESGTRVRLIAAEGEWYSVETTDGKAGYMEAAYIFPNSLGIVEHDDRFVNLRGEPSRDADILGEYGTGKMVTIVSLEADNWAQEQVNGLDGYMDMEFLTPAAYSLVLDMAREEARIARAEQAPADADPDAILDAGETLQDADVEEPQSITGPISAEAMNTEEIAFLVQTPVLSVDAADEALKTWVEGILADAGDLVTSGTVEEESLSLVVNYEVFRAVDRYTGVLQSGEMTSPQLAHPRDVVFTVNFDQSNGEVLTYEDIFNADTLDTLYALMSEKLGALDADIDAESIAPGTIDATWLQYTLLKPEGVSIILPRGEFLANAVGRQTIEFPYTELEADGLLALELSPAPAETIEDATE